MTGNIPTVLHIQGLLSLYVHIFLPPSISKWQYYMSGKGLKGKYHNYQYLAYWHRSVYREKAILKAVPHVIGRTDWDRQALAVLNPKQRIIMAERSFVMSSMRRKTAKCPKTALLSLRLYHSRPIRDMMSS